MPDVAITKMTKLVNIFKTEKWETCLAINSNLQLYRLKFKKEKKSL